MAKIVPCSDGATRASKRIQVRSSVNYNLDIVFDATIAREDNSSGDGNSTPIATKMDPRVKPIKNMDIEAGGEISEPPRKLNSLRKCFQLIYHMGMSTFNPSVETKVYRSRLNRFIDILLKVAFWTAAVFALSRSFLDAKFFWLHFTAYGGIMKFVSFGYHVMNILVQIAMIRLFAFLHGNISRMLRKLDELIEFDDTQENPQKWNREDCLMIALPIMTAIKALLQSGFDEAISNWSIGKMIEDNSKIFSTDVNFWNAEDFSNPNVTNQVDQDLAESGLATQMSMALAYMLMKFCKEIKLEIAVDLIIVGCCFLLKYIRRLNVRIKTTNKFSENNGSDLATLESPTGDWAYYETLSSANEAINVVFDELLKMMHTYNVMKFAYLLMKITDNRGSALQFVYLLYTCCRVSVAYYIAKQANGYNTAFQHWIINWAMRSMEIEFIQKAKLVLEKIKLNTLGMGTGEFVVGETFLLKFGGMVAQIFMLQVDK